MNISALHVFISRQRMARHTIAIVVFDIFDCLHVKAAYLRREGTWTKELHSLHLFQQCTNSAESILPRDGTTY